MHPIITVRIPHNTDPIWRGTLHIGEWGVPCVVGRNGLVPPNEKREGDGKTPIGRYPLRYGFYDPVNLPEFPRDLAFPFVPYDPAMWWEEDPANPDYNRLLFRAPEDIDPYALAERRAGHLFDMFIPVGWNDAIAEPHRGSAIYIHFARPAFTPSAGCICIAREHMDAFLARLAPGMMIDIAHDDAPALPVAPQTQEAITFASLAPGPKLLITGAVHGNETAGPLAITAMVDEFRSGRVALLKGQVTFIPIVNRLAYTRNTRNGDRNLNRELRPAPIPLDNEDRIANWLCRIMAAHDVLLDLHSFKSGGGPFVFVGPENNDGALEPFTHEHPERAFGIALGLPVMMSGWLSCYQKMLDQRAELGAAPLSPITGIGTTEYMRFAGGYGVTVECGQHDDPARVEVGVTVIRNALMHLGMVPGDAARTTPLHIRLEDVTLALSSYDRMARRFKTGDRVTAGELIATRASGEELRAPMDGFVIFPDHAPVEMEELFYFGVEG